MKLPAVWIFALLAEAPRPRNQDRPPGAERSVRLGRRERPGCYGLRTSDRGNHSFEPRFVGDGDGRWRDQFSFARRYREKSRERIGGVDGRVCRGGGPEICGSFGRRRQPVRTSGGQRGPTLRRRGGSITED